MCGICGKISIEGESVSSDLISRMMGSLVHRGPDDEGSYFKSVKTNGGSNITLGLGHKRLSIIDLSPDGRQPLTNEDETLWLVFNGEIYNHPTLRQELMARGHRFRSQTDSEVILHLYRKRASMRFRTSTGCLPLLFGMKPNKGFIFVATAWA